MDTWREKAAELLPELLDEITTESPMSLWIEISLRLEDTYDRKPLDDNFIGRIYKFAFWCLEQPETSSVETDLGSAVAAAFLENIPLNSRTAADLHRWLSIEDFDGFAALFQYHLDENEFAKFRTEFVTARK